MTYKVSARKQLKQGISKYKRKDSRCNSDSILPSSVEGLFSIRHTDGVRVSKPYRSVLTSKRYKSEIKFKIVNSVHDSKREEGKERATSEPITSNERGMHGISTEFLKSFQFPTLVQEIAAAVSNDVNLQPEALDALQQACTDYLDSFFQEADLCKVQIVKDSQSKSENSNETVPEESKSEEAAIVSPVSESSTALP